jgi:GH24 family phage-related lysozyme (muramidase)
LFSVQGLEHICWGFNLKKSGAREQLTALGYDLNRVLNGQQISVGDCQALLDDDMATATACAQRFVTNYNSLSASRKSVLVDMAFNLGCAGLGAFTKLKAAVQTSQWTTASYEIRNSGYCSQVGCRCNVNALCMDNCYSLPTNCNSHRAVNPPHEVCPTAVTPRPTPRPTPAPTPRPTPRPTPVPVTPCTYSSWSFGPCVGACGTNGRQTITRQVLTGAACTATSDTIPCAPPPCSCQYTAWQTVGSCKAACGQEGDFQDWTRTTTAASTGVCTETSRKTYCRGPSCPCSYSSWTDSGACTAACGQTGNFQRQSRFVLAGDNCDLPLTQTVTCTGPPCNAPPCTYSQWAQSGTGCPGPCGTPGSLIETRTKMPTGCDDKEGVSRVRGCMTAECPPAACVFSQWAATGTCNPNTCLVTEARRLTQGPAATCAGALQRAVTCNCPAPCEWGPWTEFGVCSVCDGQGVQTRTRTIKKAAVGNGAQCTGPASETQPCTGNCGGGGGGGKCSPKKECEVSPWSEYSECSPLASARKRQPVEDDSGGSGGQLCLGEKFRERRIISPPCDAGPCPALSEKADCDVECDFPQQPPPNIDVDPQPTTKPDVVNLGSSSGGGLPLGAIIGIAVAGGLCLLLLLAALIFLLVASRARSTRAGAVAHNPQRDHVVEGNPLFSSGIDKHYSPIFYGNGGDANSVAAARNAVSSAYPQMQGQTYGTSGASNYPTAYPSAAAAAAAPSNYAGTLAGASPYPSAGGASNGAYPTGYAGGGTMGASGNGHYAGSVAGGTQMLSSRSERGPYSN